MGRTSLPPGFRFHPTDVELIMYYLKRKLIGRRIPFQVISEIDIYKFAPQDLPDKSCLKSKDLEWYFYCPRERKYANGARMNRATESGFWKTTGKDRSVYFNEQPVGMVKTLVFHEGRPPKGARTDWVMYEYRLEDKGLADTEVIQDGYVLCKIFKKSGPGPKNGAQYGAPFNEEDWNDDAEVNYAASLPLVGLSTAAPVLPHIQNSSIVTSTIVPACTCSGSSSEPGPSKTVQSPDKKLPSVPDDDNDMLPIQDDYISMSDLLNDCGTALSNENDKSEEVDKLNHDGNIGAAPSLDDIFDGLGDLNDAHKAGFTVDRMLSGDGLFLDELESPLKCPAESNESECIPTVGLPVYNNCYRNTELLCSQVNPYGIVNHSMFSPSLVLPEGNCAYNDHLDLFQKENSVKENGSHGYQECEGTSNNANATLCEQSELEGSHNPRVQTRGEQQRKYSSRLQHLLESIPARPASAAEHPDPVNGVTRFKGSTLLSSYGCSSIHVKAEVTLGGGGCTKDALSDKLEEFPCMCCYGCNLPRRNSRKEAADYGNGFSFVFFVGILLALIWIFVGAVIITKLGRYAWSLVLS